MSTTQGTDAPFAKAVFGLCVTAAYVIILGAIAYVVLHGGPS